MDLQARFITHLNSFSFTSQTAKLLVAVSGGVDSVVLCNLLFNAGCDFIIAHCNFQLRADESERDELFVRELGVKYEKQIFVQRFKTTEYATTHKLSTQVAARDLRYNWFRKLAEEHALKFIVTAHHADDNIETVVMNFFRGTGLRGLIGMNDIFMNIYRPLLPFRKKEILTYAKEHNLPFVEDSSNASIKYTRNYFRNELLPAVEKVFPAAEENILKNIERLKQVEEVFNQAIKDQKKRLVEQKGKELHIPILKLQKTNSYKIILWEIIHEFNYSAGQLDEVMKLLDAGNGSFIDSSSHRIIKNRKWIIINKKEQEEKALHIVITGKEKKVRFAQGELVIEKKIPAASYTISLDKNVAAFDAAEITFPLILRKWKQGDYFYPLGMKKKKKLSRFLIDQKVSMVDKEKVWVLEMDKKIIWIVGQRIDDRFKITGSSKEVVKINWSPLNHP